MYEYDCLKSSDSRDLKREMQKEKKKLISIKKQRLSDHKHVMMSHNDL